MIRRWPTGYEREQAARKPWRRALRVGLYGVAWLAFAALGFWLLWGCAPTARDTASAAYSRLYVEMAHRAETPVDFDCLGAIEEAWQRAWDARRAADFAVWVLGEGWRDLPACERATFGGAP